MVSFLEVLGGHARLYSYHAGVKDNTAQLLINKNILINKTIESDNISPVINRIKVSR